MSLDTSTSFIPPYLTLTLVCQSESYGILTSGEDTAPLANKQPKGHIPYFLQKHYFCPEGRWISPPLLLQPLGSPTLTMVFHREFSTVGCKKLFSLDCSMHFHPSAVPKLYFTFLKDSQKPKEELFMTRYPCSTHTQLIVALMNSSSFSSLCVLYPCEDNPLGSIFLLAYLLVCFVPCPVYLLMGMFVNTDSYTGNNAKNTFMLVLQNLRYLTGALRNFHIINHFKKTCHPDYLRQEVQTLPVSTMGKAVPFSLIDPI